MWMVLEPSWVQEQRIQEQRWRGDSREVDGEKVVGHSGQNIENLEEAHEEEGEGAGALVSEVLWELSMETVCEVAHWFGKEF